MGKELFETLDKIEKLEQEAIESACEIQPLEVPGNDDAAESVELDMAEYSSCRCSSGCGNNYNRGDCRCSSGCGNNYNRGDCRCSSGCGNNYSQG